MFLVSAAHYHNRDKRRRRPLSSPRERKRAGRFKNNHPYEEWLKMRHKFSEADIRRKTQTKAISDFLRRVITDTTTTSNR